MVKIPSKLHVLVHDKYNTAVKAGSLIFSETSLAVIRANDIPFQLRFCPALSKKSNSTPPIAPTKKPFDPFENPEPELLITELSPSHRLVLNKYPVIEKHFLLTSKEFKEQTHILEEEDLGVAYACVKAWKEVGRELFGFFNSGEHSGASQRHRHLQFLDVELMRGGKEGEGWEVLADTLAHDPTIIPPFAVFSSKLPDDPSPSTLYKLYRSMHQKAVSMVESQFKLHNTEDGSSAISYNLGITHKSMVLCPRRNETGKLSSDASFEQPALNGTILAGTLMVKSEAAFDAMRKDPGKLRELLKDIGFPPLDQHHMKL